MRLEPARTLTILLRILPDLSCTIPDLEGNCPYLRLRRLFPAYKKELSREYVAQPLALGSSLEPRSAVLCLLIRIIVAFA
jgi:hypothetical protein